MNMYFLQLQMGISCIAACIHSLILSLWETICLCLPYTLPSGSYQGSFLSASPSPGWKIPALTAFLCTLCAPALSSLCPTAGLHPVPQPLSSTEEPQTGHSAPRAASPVPKSGWRRIAALSSTPVVSSLQLGFMVLVTTWWSCQDIFWTAQSLKITAEIVR